MTHTIIPSTLCLVLIALVKTATAANDPLSKNPESPWYGFDFDRGWHFDMGLAVEYEPTYAGSDEYEAEGDLLARALYRTEAGHRYFINLGEIGAIFSLSPSTQLQFFFEYEEERSDAEDKTLTGLNAIDATVEAQLMLAHRFGNTTVYGALQPDITGDANKGLVWFVGAGYDWMIKNHMRMGVRLDVSGADSEHMRTEFGITAQESQRTNYTVYQPDSGLKSMTLGLTAEYFFSNTLSLLSMIETEYYFSEASNSPLIDQEGDDTTVEASITLRWRF